MAKRKKTSMTCRPDRQQYWKQMISKWQLGGLSQAAFCRHHKVHAQLFSKWKLRLAESSPATVEPGPPTQADFIEIKQPISKPCVYEIITPSLYTIKIEGHCNPDVLSDILSAMRHSC